MTLIPQNLKMNKCGKKPIGTLSGNQGMFPCQSFMGTLAGLGLPKQEEEEEVSPLCKNNVITSKKGYHGSSPAAGCSIQAGTAC